MENLLAQFYPAKIYTKADNIPSKTIYDIAQTPDHLMWFLSAEGIFNYNSNDWGLMPDSLDFPNSEYSVLTLSEDSTLWTAGQTSREFAILKMTNEGWKKLNIPSDLKKIDENFSFYVDVNAEPTEIIIGLREEIHSFDIDGKNHNITELPAKMIVNSVKSVEREILLATSQGLYTYRKNKIEPKFKPNEPLSPEILQLKYHKGKTYLLGVGWIGYLEGGEFSIRNSNIDVSRASAYNKNSLEIDSNDKIYFSAHTPPAYLTTSNSVQFLKIQEVNYGLLSSRLFVDREGNIWNGDYLGLFKFSNSSFKLYNEKTGLLQDEVTAIVNVGNETVIANPNGLNFFDGKSITKRIKIDDQSGRALDLAYNQNGDIVIAYSFGGLKLLKNGRLKSLNHLIPPDTHVSAAKNFQGSILIAANFQILKISEKFDNVDTLITSESSLRTLNIVGKDTIVGLTHRKGLFMLANDDETWYKAKMRKYNVVYAIVNWRGQYLVATAGGLAKLENNEIVPYQIGAGSFKAITYCFLNNANKELWIGSNEGIYIWNGKEVISFPESGKFTGSEVSRNALAKFNQNSLLVGTNKGLSKVDLNEGLRSKLIPKLRFKEIKSKGGIIINNDSVELRYDDNNIDFSFVGISYTYESLIRYRYQLEGFESEWAYQNSDQLNSVRYTNLKPGAYTFTVQSSISNGTWSSIISRSFKIDKPYYLKAWFIILCAVVFFLTLYLIYRIRFYVIIKNQERLQALVVEKTQQLAAANEELKANNEDLHNTNAKIKKQRRQLENTVKQLKETQSQLVQSEKMASLGVLIAGVAHEINNPLNFIMGSYSGLVSFMDEHCEKNERSTRLLNILKTGVERVSNIVNSLNQFSRKQDKMDEHCDIHVIIENCLLILNNQFKDKIEITKQYSEEDIHIRGNAGKLHQVFLNILANSVHAINSKGSIIIHTLKQEQYISINVTDDGSGISKENISKILDPFFTTKDPGKGTGLGLSITYTIIQEHMGHIEFISEEKKGTKVAIKLPIDRESV